MVALWFAAKTQRVHVGVWQAGNKSMFNEQLQPRDWTNCFTVELMSLNVWRSLALQSQDNFLLLPEEELRSSCRPPDTQQQSNFLIM